MSTPPSPTISGSSSLSSLNSSISFCYIWTTKIKTRKTTDGEATILSISPKFATVHQSISFQWNVRVHATMALEDENSEDENYIAVDLYLVDGPINEVRLMAEVAALDKNAMITAGYNPANALVREAKSIKLQKGVGCEVTDSSRSCVSSYLKQNIENVVKLSVIVTMESRLFDPFTYLDAISPTPRVSFLTANYNARVNSKVWKRRSRKRNCRVERRAITDDEKLEYEKKVQAILDQERGKLMDRLTIPESSSRRASLMSQFKENQHEMIYDDHIFKRILVSCCESCEQRRRSLMYDSRTEEDSEDDGDDAKAESDGDDDEPHFECDQRDKEHIHDMLANLYFNKVVLPQLEFIEDFMDFLIDAELNDLPVLKRACERYLCSELSTKKDISTCLLLDLLFNAIVFNLAVMKSMTLSELSNRAHEFVDVELLLQQEEYQNLDKRMKNLADRNLPELIEQCVNFREQKARVRVLPAFHEEISFANSPIEQ
ncbi:unnamed protein product [Caenorhabditis bovis]|uniref:Uncharacterized protein n=1 Tax=Caenorhabditis bovis TaxID=2654633 RepID=A0A8S1F449_9PELO|nr:unnamed protein product [Caenorhabditis bovis]